LVRDSKNLAIKSLRHNPAAAVQLPLVLTMAQVSQNSNLLLSALPSEDLALLRPYLAEVRLKQKVVIQEENAPIAHAFFPLSGMISLVATFETGEAIEIAAIGREGAIGTRPGLPPQSAFAKAIVQLPGMALKIDIRRFQEAARKSVAITHIATCANEVMAINLQQSAACNALHHLESRLARWLLHSHDRIDGDDLPLAHVFLSQMLGVRRTTVSLAAHTLQKAGVIDYHRGKIRITDRKALENISCDCYRMVRQNIDRISAAANAAKTLGDD
jgi:CRP-like cAMP-binding protein